MKSTIDNYELARTLLQSQATRKVLRKLAANKKAQLRELLQYQEIDRKELLEAVEKLKKLNLIKTSESSVPDLSTYFVTAEGLQADRTFES